MNSCVCQPVQTLYGVIMSPIRQLFIPILVAALFLGVLQVHLFVYERELESRDGTVVAEKQDLPPVDRFCVPIPDPPSQNPALVKLGSRLFHDSRLSTNNTMSCSRCHRPDKGGTDQLPLSPTMSGGFRSRNTPTVFNVHFVHAYGWDGVHESLEEQVRAVLTSPLGLGTTTDLLRERLASDRDYAAAFTELFPGGVSLNGVVHSLCAYLRSLTTPDCAVDRFLAGEGDALSAEARAGMDIFREFGCSSCHQGVKLGDNLFSRFGVFGDYFEDLGNVTRADLGRYNVTGDPEDMFVFRVPGLRNVALTHPYFHDGSVTDLGRAVNVMATYQLGRMFPEKDLAPLLAFLRALTGTVQENAR